MVSNATVISSVHDSQYGFMETELGPLPEDWQLVELGNVYEFQNGVNAAAKDYGRGTRFANVLEVLTHSHLLGSKIPGRVAVSRATASAFSVKKGDLLFNRTSETQNELGLASVYCDDEPIVFGGFVIRARQKTLSFHPTYTGYAFRAPFVRRQIISSGQGAVRSNIGQQSLRRVLVPLPSFKEQEAIAEALSDADALIESLEALIAKKRAVKQAAMQDLLSGRKRLPGFGREWKQSSFAEVFDFLPTATNSRADLSTSGDTYYVHYGDIHTRFHSHLDFIKQFVPRIRKAICPNAMPLKNGDWIMADASEDFDGVGKSIEVLGLRNEELAVSGLHTFLLREKTKTYAPGFKGHLGNANELRRQYLRVMTGMKVYGVSKTALKNLLLPIPEWAEQEAITEILDDLDEEIQALEDKLSKARQMKQGMMQELLTGRVRLV